MGFACLSSRGSQTFRASLASLWGGSIGPILPFSLPLPKVCSFQRTVSVMLTRLQYTYSCLLCRNPLLGPVFKSSVVSVHKGPFVFAPQILELTETPLCVKWQVHSKCNKVSELNGYLFELTRGAGQSHRQDIFAELMKCSLKCAGLRFFSFLSDN